MSPQIQLPPGYRFNPRDEELINPRDEELINHYLWRRLLYEESPSCPRMPLVNNIFGDEADHPSIVFDSFGNSDRQEEYTVRYFFTNPKTKASDKACAKNRIRAAGIYGTWKLQRSDPIMVKNRNEEEEVVGFRKLLKFMESKGVGGVNGVEWSMHEFSSSKVEKNNFKDEYVVCRITKKVSNRLVGKKRAQESSIDESSTTSCINVIQENKRQHVDDDDVLVPVIEGAAQEVLGLDGNNSSVSQQQHKHSQGCQSQEKFDATLMPEESITSRKVLQQHEHEHEHEQHNNKDLEVDDIEAELAKYWDGDDDDDDDVVVGFCNANTTQEEVDSVDSSNTLNQSESESGEDDKGCDSQFKIPWDFEFDFNFGEDELDFNEFVQPSQVTVLKDGLVWPRQLDL